MRKILLIGLLFLFFMGCSKHKSEQETGQVITPSAALTESADKAANPSENPVPVATETPSDTNIVNTDSSMDIFRIDSIFSTTNSEADESNIIQNLLNEENNKFTGMIGESKIHMTLSYQDNKITGVYYYDKYKTEINVSGKIIFELKDYPSINLFEDSEQYGSINGIIRTKDYIEGYWQDYDHMYPMYLMREGADVKAPEKPGKHTQSFAGHWYGNNSTYYSKSDLDITALFNDMIYYDLEAQSGSNVGSYSGVAIVNQDAANALLGDYNDWNRHDDFQLFEFTQQMNDLCLNSNDYNYGCGMWVSFDNQYSKEEAKIEEPTALEVGIVSTSEQEDDFRDLVRTYYSDFINNTQYVDYKEITLDGEKVMAGESVFQGMSSCCYYIISEDSIYAAFSDEKDIKYFTNDGNYIDYMPKPMQEWADEKGLKIIYYNADEALPFDESISDTLKDQMELIKKGQKIILPKGYTMMDYSEGDINQDGQKDIAVVIQQDPGSVSGSRCIYLYTQKQGKYHLQSVNSKIALGSEEGGVWGDPFYGISLGEGELHVYDHGGSSFRWSHDYQFKMYENKLMLSNIEMTDYNINTQNGTISRYDLLNGTVQIKTYSVAGDYSDKWLNLLLYSGSIDADYQINFENAGAWQETEIKTVPQYPMPTLGYYRYCEKDYSQLILNKPADILDKVQKTYYPKMKKVDLPCSEEIIKSYSKLLGIEIPTYYYTDGTHNLYYYELEDMEDKYLHTIMYVAIDSNISEEDASYIYRDDTGEEYSY